MGSKMTFCSFQCSLRPVSLNSALGVKVGLRAAVFYGFPYKLRPKPKIATLSGDELVSEPDPRGSGSETSGEQGH